MSEQTVSLPPEIVSWIESLTGGKLVASDRRPGGARKEAWLVDVQMPDGHVEDLFCRYDRSDPAKTGDPWTLRREATVYLALQGREVPVPRVIGVHPELQAMLSERLVGENWFSRITDPAEALSTAQDFMKALAALHRIDARTLDLPMFPEIDTIADSVRAELDEWEESIAFRGGEVDPALKFTLDWLRRNIPDYDGPPVLIQGDTGPGNFMYRDGKVLAVVDWELAHLGDPMDDIAWLSLRAVQEPFTHLPDRLREYTEMTGNEIDVDRVQYYRVMAEAKLLVMNHRPGGPGSRYAADPGGDLGNALIYTMLHRRLWLEALAELVEFERRDPEMPGEVEVRGHDWMYDAVLDQMRKLIVPRISDPLASTRTKGIARVIKHLADVNRYGPFFEAGELDDLTQLLDERPASVESGRRELNAAVAAGTVSDGDYLGYMWRRIGRDNELARAASGALADRHWPDLL